mgnify:CR=1 FL=1
MNGRGRRAHFLVAAAGGAGRFGLRLTRTSALLASAAELAGDSRTRRRGLLGRARLEPGEALVIAPTQGIHTFGMRFAIDVVFVDRRGRVVAIADAVPPWRCRFSWRAFAAVELPAGSCRAAGLVAGDELDVLPLG